MAELVDALVSGTSGESRGGSSPLLGTIQRFREAPENLNDHPPASRRPSRPLARYKNSVAIDTETMGLDPHRDRLCVVQLVAGRWLRRCGADSAGRRRTRRISSGCWPTRRSSKSFTLRASILRPCRKAFGVMAVAALLHQDRLAAYPHLHRQARAQGSGARTARRRPVQAAAIVRLGRRELTEAQVAYAASDVLHLHALKDKLDTHAGAGKARPTWRRPVSASCPTGPGSIWRAGRLKISFPIHRGCRRAGAIFRSDFRSIRP